MRLTKMVDSTTHCCPEGPAKVIVMLLAARADEEAANTKHTTVHPVDHFDKISRLIFLCTITAKDKARKGRRHHPHKEHASMEKGFASDPVPLTELELSLEASKRWFIRQFVITQATGKSRIIDDAACTVAIDGGYTACGSAAFITDAAVLDVNGTTTVDGSRGVLENMPPEE